VRIFDDSNVSRLLRGEQFIDAIPSRFRHAILDKHLDDAGHIRDSFESASSVEGIVAELNRDLARFEQLKKVVLIADEFSAENGLLTATMKVRRSTVEQRYRRQIEETILSQKPSFFGAAPIEGGGSRRICGLIAASG
jgi:hypothetical protein